MSLTILNNSLATQIEYELNGNLAATRKSLNELTTGSRISSGADDAAGLSISDSLNASIAALRQSSINARQGVELLQTADGALAQVTRLLDRMIVLGVERYGGSTHTAAQQDELALEYQSCLDGIKSIGVNTTFNGQRLFGTYVGPSGQNVYSIVTSDGTASGTSVEALRLTYLYNDDVGDPTGDGGIGTRIPQVGENGYYYEEQNLPSWRILFARQAVDDVASERAYLGSEINQLQATENVADTERVNLAEAQDSVQAADLGKVTADLVREGVRNQTGVSALSQERAQQEAVLKLLR